MKKINRLITSVILCMILSIQVSYANGFPAEPMIIYGSITGNNIENRQLKVYDGNGTFLTSGTIINGQYGTNKTFDLNNKLILGSFEGNLEFRLGDTILIPENGNEYNCEGNMTFQKAKICEYNFADVQVGIDKINNLNEILEIEKTQNFSEIFSGKILEVNEDSIKNEIGTNIVANKKIDENLIVINKAINVETMVTKDVVLIGDDQKEMVFIPKNTNTQQNNLVIEKPIKIVATNSIKNKINKDVYGAIEIPTSNQVNFDQDIRICLDSNVDTIVGTQIYASHDNSTWFHDTSAKNITLMDNQLCFDVNHLTSFAVTKQSMSNNSTGGGSGGGNYRPYCTEEQLVCREVSGNYYYREKDISVCRLRNSRHECTMNETVIGTGTFSTKEVALPESQKTSEKKSIKEYKLTSKNYITGVRTFIKNKRDLRVKHGLQVSYVSGEVEYNKTVDMLLNDIHKDIKLQSIQERMVKYIDTMSTSYGVYKDNTVSDELQSVFKEKFKNDYERVKKQMKVLKRKDYIINKVLTERKLQREQLKK